MSIEALVRHQWWSTRRRWRVAAIAVAAHAVAVTAVFAFLQGGAPADWEMSQPDRSNVASVLASYEGYLRATWSGGLAGLLALVGVVLGVGGVASEARQGTLDLTLSLPVGRWVWPIARFALTLGLLLILGLLSTVLVALGGYGIGAEVPASFLIANLAIAGLGSAFVASLAVAAGTFASDALTAGFAAILLLYAFIRGGPHLLAGWSPGGVFDPAAWLSAPAWRPVTSTVILSLVFLIVAVLRSERAEVSVRED